MTRMSVQLSALVPPESHCLLSLPVPVFPFYFMRSFARCTHHPI
jgi:hypothetical protein